MAKDQQPEAPAGQPAAFTKEQFLASRSGRLPRDVLAAVLEDGKQYTKEEAAKRVSSYLERKV